VGTTRRSALLIAFEFVPVFLFRRDTYAGTCMSIEHIFMRPSRPKRYHRVTVGTLREYVCYVGRLKGSMYLVNARLVVRNAAKT